jgi:hypothetical protein
MALSLEHEAWHWLMAPLCSRDPLPAVDWSDGSLMDLCDGASVLLAFCYFTLV